MTSGKDDEEFFRARGFGVKIGFGDRPALIVIDMIKGFTNPDMPLGAPLEAQMAAQKPLIDDAHDRGIPAIFSTVIYNEYDLKDAGLWGIKMKGSLTLKAGTEAVEVDPRLGEMRADERKFKQILLNLLSNAIKFTPEGGRIAVDARLNGAGLEIAVSDTGIGISPTDQAAVFEEFRQVGPRAEGTGLGLALTRKFVELHGGSIRLDSAPGQGTTFTFTLPQ